MLDTPGKQRAASLVFLFAASIVLICLGHNGLTLDFIPAEYIGYLLAGLGLLGLLGVNIWYGGPLDRRNDPKPPEGGDTDDQ